MKAKFRYGFVLSMRTGEVTNGRGLPILFKTERTARKYLARMPAWGRAAVFILPCKTRMGANGIPDYFIG